MRSAWKWWARVVVVALGASGLGAGCVPGSLGRSAERSAEREVLERVLRSSVQVVLEQNGDRFRTGSGVIIGARPPSDCFVLTSAHTFHAISPSSEAYVLLDRHQGEGMRGRAEVLALRDTDEVDLALLEARGLGCRATPLGRPPALGDRIWIVGFPWGRQLRLISGIVSQITLDDHGRRQMGSTLMVDASVAYGMSGGGVFDALSGRLVGLVQGYGTARVPFGEKAALQYIDVPVPGETYVTSLETIDRFLRDAGHSDLAAAPRS